MENKERAEKCNINISSFKYANLLTCEWLVYVDERTVIYFTDNINPCRSCRETKLSYLLRKLGLKRYVTFGKPRTLRFAESPPPNFSEPKEIPNYRIRFAGNKNDLTI